MGDTGKKRRQEQERRDLIGPRRPLVLAYSDNSTSPEEKMARLGKYAVRFAHDVRKGL